MPNIRLNEALQAIRLVLPDISSRWVIEALKAEMVARHPDAVSRVIRRALELKDGYPISRDAKGRGGKKAKKAEEKKPEEDYRSMKYRVDERRGVVYLDKSQGLLFELFPMIPVHHIINTLQLHGSLLVPAYFALLAESEAEEKPYQPLPVGRNSENSRRLLDEDLTPCAEGEAAIAAEASERERNGLTAYILERAWLSLLLNKEREEREARAAEEERRAAAFARGEGIECGCCFDDKLIDELYQCSEGHLFCLYCTTQHVEGKLGKQQVCMDASFCEALFPDSELERLLSAESLRLYHRLQQAKELKMANLEGLESCPFCPYSAIIENPEEKLFRCQAPDCGRVSCRACKRDNHLPRSCQEMENDRRLNKRHVVEDAMTAALIRKCPKCEAPFIKEYGCNKMMCDECRTMSCYVCGKIVEDYTHFGDAPGQCLLYTPNEAEDEQAAIVAARDAARAEALEAAAAEGVQLADADLIIEGPAVVPRLVPIRHIPAGFLARLPPGIDPQEAQRLFAAMLERQAQRRPRVDPAARPPPPPAAPGQPPAAIINPQPRPAGENVPRPNAPGLARPPPPPPDAGRAADVARRLPTDAERDQALQARLQALRNAADEDRRRAKAERAELRARDERRERAHEAQIRALMEADVEDRRRAHEEEAHHAQVLRERERLREHRVRAELRANVEKLMAEHDEREKLWRNEREQAEGRVREADLQLAQVYEQRQGARHLHVQAEQQRRAAGQQVETDAERQARITLDHCERAEGDVRLSRDAARHDLNRVRHRREEANIRHKTALRDMLRHHDIRRHELRALQPLIIPPRPLIHLPPNPYRPGAQARPPPPPAPLRLLANAPNPQVIRNPAAPGPHPPQQPAQPLAVPVQVRVQVRPAGQNAPPPPTQAQVPAGLERLDPEVLRVLMGRARDFIAARQAERFARGEAAGPGEMLDYPRPGENQPPVRIQDAVELVNTLVARMRAGRAAQRGARADPAWAIPNPLLDGAAAAAQAQGDVDAEGEGDEAVRREVRAVLDEAGQELAQPPRPVPIAPPVTPNRDPPAYAPAQAFDDRQRLLQAMQALLAQYPPRAGDVIRPGQGIGPAPIAARAAAPPPAPAPANPQAEDPQDAFGEWLRERDDPPPYDEGDHAPR